MIDKLRRRLTLYRQWGLVRSTRITTDQAVLGAARLAFGFAKWHAQAPTSLRTYRVGLAAVANDFGPSIVVDVGCGLGAVLNRIKAPIRVGYDIDADVIRAATAFRSRDITFRVGSFPDIVESEIDLLIAVNWLHDFASNQLDEWFTPLLSRTRYLLVDAIAPTAPSSYPHFHDFAFLADRTTCIRTEKLGEQHRTFMLLKVNR